MENTLSTRNNLPEHKRKYYAILWFLSSVMRYVLRSETMNKHNLLCDILLGSKTKTQKIISAFL